MLAAPLSLAPEHISRPPGSSIDQARAMLAKFSSLFLVSRQRAVPHGPWARRETSKPSAAIRSYSGLNVCSQTRLGSNSRNAGSASARMKREGAADGVSTPCRKTWRSARRASDIDSDHERGAHIVEEGGVEEGGGARRSRTADLLNAIQALSQ